MNLEVFLPLQFFWKSFRTGISSSPKVHLVKIMVFPVVMYGCKSCTVKKAECWRIDAFEPWCWRRLLRVPCTAKRSNQSILKEISPGCSLEGLMLSWNSNTLATSCEELTHWKRPWCWEGLGTGGEGDDRGWDGWMASSTRCTWVWVKSRSWWRTGRPGVQSRTWLSDWTKLNILHWFKKENRCFYFVFKDLPCLVRNCKRKIQWLPKDL